MLGSFQASGLTPKAESGGAGYLYWMVHETNLAGGNWVDSFYAHFLVDGVSINSDAIGSGTTTGLDSVEIDNLFDADNSITPTTRSRQFVNPAFEPKTAYLEFASPVSPTSLLFVHGEQFALDRLTTNVKVYASNDAIDWELMGSGAIAQVTYARLEITL